MGFAVASEENHYRARLIGFTDNASDVEILEPASDGDKAEIEDLSKRSPFQRDLDRIKYTREFRRLKDVTQVARAGESYLYHDRLSHSLKVGQVGRRFAEYILERESNSRTLDQEVDPDLIEAACLAHDLGHPPFGHLAESTLDEILQEKTNPYYNENDVDDNGIELPEEINVDDTNKADAYLKALNDTLPGIRFEGNAQSFRILTRLASHRDANTGLALTLGVLMGVGKYPYGRGEWFDSDSHPIDGPDDWPDEPETINGRSNKKFGFYKEDQSLYDELRDAAKPGTVSEVGRTAAADIMDYADDLTYAIHDLTDFYKDGRLPLDRLLREALGELDEEELKGIEQIKGFENIENKIAPIRELDKLHDELDYDDCITTPTNVIGSLVTTVVLTGKSKSILKPFEGTEKQREEIEGFTSFLIEEYLNRIYEHEIDPSKLEGEHTNKRHLGLYQSSEGCELYMSPRLKEQLSILQQITKYYVIRQPSLMAQQRGQRQIIRELFDALYQEASKDDLTWSAIPEPYRSWLQEESVYLQGLDTPQEKKARAVADFITSMTEPQVVALHKRITGDNPGSLQDDIIR